MFVCLHNTRIILVSGHVITKISNTGSLARIGRVHIFTAGKQYQM